MVICYSSPRELTQLWGQSHSSWLLGWEAYLCKTYKEQTASLTHSMNRAIGRMAHELGPLEWSMQTQSHWEDQLGFGCLAGTAEKPNQGPASSWGSFMLSVLWGGEAPGSGISRPLLITTEWGQQGPTPSWHSCGDSMRQDPKESERYRHVDTQEAHK